MSKNLKNISTVAGATVVSRVLGLVREIAITAVFGTGALASAYTSAFTLPNLFRRLLGEGSLTAAFVPTLAHELEHRQRPAAFALVNKVVSWLLLVTFGIVALAMLLLLGISAWLQPAGGTLAASETVQRWALGADLAVILFPYMIVVCLAAAFSAACQVLGRFTEPAWSPVWLNLAILASLGLGGWWAWGDRERMNLLCTGVLIGGFLQMAVPAWVLWQEGWRPAFDLRSDDRVREIARLMGPTVIGSAVYLANMAASRFLGLSLHERAAMLLNLATRVMELPIGIFTAAIATVVFPLIARHAAKSDWTQLGVDYHKGLRLVLVINVPAGVGLALLSEPVTRLLFERGAFAAGDTRIMTPILAACALGLPFLSFTTVALRGFYALKDTATPVRAAILSFAVNVVGSLVLMRWFSTLGLAVAGNLAVLAQGWYLQRKLAQRLPALAFAPVGPSLGKILLASLLMGLAVWGGAWALDRVTLPARLHDLLVVTALIPLAVAVYAGLLWLLKIEGREELAGLLQRVRGKSA